jgi:hypothetical protein
MNEPIKTDFVPRWARAASSEHLEAVGDTPFTGGRPYDWPRIVARALPSTGRNCLDSKSVVEIIEMSQRLTQYAACDEILGFNPNFADLRQLEGSIVALSKLTIDPFEEGSFVIPARFEADDLDTSELRTDTTAEPKLVSTEQIATRFGTILESVITDATTISIGALETIKQMHRTLKRDVIAIEFATFDRLEQRRKFQLVDPSYMQRVDSAIKHRQTTVTRLEYLSGRITALDLHREELKLSIAGQRDRVEGKFQAFLHQTLLDALGKKVELYGKVDFRGGRPKSISIHQAEILE